MTPQQAPDGRERKAKTHHLKTWPEYFKEISSGNKTFEVRKNDRDYQVGDILYLHEWLPLQQEYTGGLEIFKISYILYGGQFGIEEGVCVMSLKEI
jgi:hypothetical protein